MGKFTFRKEERLYREKHIQELFKKGSSFYLFPFKVSIVVPKDCSATHQILISISKKKFSRAVDRNLLKRRVREAYRLNKHLLLPAKALHIGFVYSHHEILTSREISSKMVHVLRKISQFKPLEPGPN